MGAEYNATALVQLFHSMPRWTFSLHRLAANVSTAGSGLQFTHDYEESVAMPGAAVVLLAVVLFLAFFLAGLCVCCCHRQRQVALRKNGCGCQRAFLALFAILITCVLPKGERQKLPLHV